MLSKTFIMIAKKCEGFVLLSVLESFYYSKVIHSDRYVDSIVGGKING